MKTPQRISGQRQAQRRREMARQKRMLQIKQNRQPLIPSEVLKALAEMHLPKNKKLLHEISQSTAQHSSVVGATADDPLGDGHSGSLWCSAHGCRFFL